MQEYNNNLGVAPQVSNMNVEDRAVIGVPWRILVGSFVLFILSIFVYFGLKFGYSNYLEARAGSLDKQINVLAAEVSEADQEKLVVLYSQLANLDKILKRHSYTSNIFSFLEKNTLGSVYFTEASFSADEYSLSLSGFARDGETMTAQMAVFDAVEELDSSVLDEFNVVKGGTRFSLTLTFNPSYFVEQK